MRKLAALALVIPLAACTVSVNSDGSGDSAACEEFAKIALAVEEEGTQASVADQLNQIADQAQQDGQDAVAKAAQDLLAAKQSSDRGAWYAAFGAMEAACGPYGY